MKAIDYYQPGEAGNLRWLDEPQPQLEERDLLVRVEAVSVNPADCKLRASKKPEDGKPVVLGDDGPCHRARLMRARSF